MYPSICNPNKEAIIKVKYNNSHTNYKKKIQNSLEGIECEVSSSDANTIN